MSRSILTIIALSALLSAAACNTVTGPVGDDLSVPTNAPSGGDRDGGDQIASPDEMTPGEGEGGGGTDIKEETYVAPAPRVDPVEQAPVDTGN